jgi:hypothetical protein
MNMPTLLPAALVVAAMLATPVMARENRAARQPTTRVYVSAAPGEHYYNERYCVPAPRVGAFASQPWDYEHGNVPCEPVATY